MVYMRIQFNWSCQVSNPSCVQDSTSARCCSPPARHSNHWMPHFLPRSLLCTLAYIKWLCHRARATTGKSYSSQNKIFELYNSPYFLAVWHYVSKKSHLYCIYFTIIMCAAISDFTQYVFTQCRNAQLKII